MGSKFHFAAFLSTCCAFDCTSLAMISFMTAAFFGTRFADVCAYPANFIDELTSQAHKLGGCIANSCALHVQLNAFRHDGGFFFPEAE